VKFIILIFALQKEQIVERKIETSEETQSPSPTRTSSTLTSGSIADISSIEHSSSSKGSHIVSSQENSILLQHSSASKVSDPSPIVNQQEPVELEAEVPNVTPGNPSVMHEEATEPSELLKPSAEVTLDDLSFAKPTVPLRKSSVGSLDRSKSSKSSESMRRSSSLFSTMSDADSTKPFSPEKTEDQSKSSKSSESIRRSISLFSTFSENEEESFNEVTNKTLMQEPSG
jgi:hypothetical protein